MIKASGGDVVAELLTPRFLGAEATDISLNKIAILLLAAYDYVLHETLQ